MLQGFLRLRIPMFRVWGLWKPSRFSLGVEGFRIYRSEAMNAEVSADSQPTPQIRRFKFGALNPTP